MTKFIIIILFLIAGPFIYGQNNKYEDERFDGFQGHHKGNKNCDSRVQKADSSINYTFDPLTGSYTPAQVLQYFYDDELNLKEVINRSLPGGEKIYRQLFEYNDLSYLNRYTYQQWDGIKWEDQLYVDKTYVSDGIILTEIYSRKNLSGDFEPFMQHLYSNDGSRNTEYLRQLKDADGNWYSFSNHYYTYDGLGRLTILYGKYYNSDIVYWERTNVYGSDGKVTDRYFRTLKYDPVLRKNILTNNEHQIYSYNIYGNAQEILNYSWIDLNWVYSSKDIGYFSLLAGKKVSICHNGKSLCVSANAVKAHLEHGDKLGLCDCEKEQKEKDDWGKERKETENKGIIFRVYPNPAKDVITVKFDEIENPYTEGYLFSNGGRVIKSFSVNGLNSIDIDISGLREGTYFIRMLKEKGYDTRTIIKE